MTVEPTTAPIPVAQNVARPDRSAAWLCGAFICLAFAHAPLLYWHLCSILAKPHYQFVILLPVAVGALAWQRWKKLQELRPGMTSVNYALGIASLSILAIATWLWSPWLGSVAATISVLAVVYVIGGFQVAVKLLPAWLMLWFAVALPLDLDLILIQELREYATAWTGAVLDWIGIRHLVEGNVIHVPDQSFFVADACTGIHSLFVVAAMAMFLGFWNERRPHQVFVLLLCAFGLVLIENVSRLVAVVVICEWGVDVSEGWRHKMLGGAVFVATLGLLVSADQLISFLIPERLLFFWANHFKRKSRSHDTPKPPAIPLALLRWKPLMPLLGCFFLVGIWQVARAPANAPQLAETLGNPFEPLEQLPSTAMPPRIDDWIQTDHEFISRNVEDPQGQFSQIWTYERGNQSIQVALDFPFPAIHDACLCFENTGWTIDRQQMLEDPKSDAGVVQAYLSKPLAGQMYLLSSFFNTRGEFGTRIYPRQESSADGRIVSRLNSLVGKQTNAGPPGTRFIQGPVCQVRLATSYHEGFTDEHAAPLIEFFLKARVFLESACSDQLRKAQ